MQKTWLLTVGYYVAAALAIWLALENSSPANGGSNEGMVFAAVLVVVSCVLTLVSLVRTLMGNKSTPISTCIHLLVVLSFFSWWSSLR